MSLSRLERQPWVLPNTAPNLRVGYGRIKMPPVLACYLLFGLVLHAVSELYVTTNVRQQVCILTFPSLSAALYAD